MAYRRAALSELLGDFVVYRNLCPMDPRLPGFPELREELGLKALPRKGTPDYARAVVRILAAAQRLRGSELSHIVYIGDTRHNDGRTIASLGEFLPIRGFIAAEAPEGAPEAEISGGVMFANRWGLLARFAEWLEKEGFPVDGGTAVIVDLDKTAFGARGRNSGPIDAARVAAAERLAEASGGEPSVLQRFREAYRELNDPVYHPFTADNQDFVVFAALVTAYEAYPLSRLRADVVEGKLRTFTEFLEVLGKRPLPRGLVELYREIEEGVHRGDPTPLKTFRRLEYRETLARIDRLPDASLPGEILREEIVITPEVWEFATEAEAKGALIFGLTDKPDEASLPPPGESGPPLHRARMKVLP